ncbi:hypothetical protein GGR51DRAFT_313981 [Nemania sp. FL0031]|nr:hypothetical protein GGR51DRAFT_313981 [Nemania sp. FL0031]
MKLGCGLQSTLRAAITLNKRKLQIAHCARPISYTRNLIFSPATTQHRPSIQTSPLSFRRIKTTRLSSTSRPSQPPIMDTLETKSENSNSTQPEPKPLSLPALPAAGEGTSTLEVGGAALRLDHLGPLVVNEDGTLSRIANWEKMADIERENTLRILGKRNQARLAKLRAAKGETNSSENKPAENGEKQQ